MASGGWDGAAEKEEEECGGGGGFTGGSRTNNQEKAQYAVQWEDGFIIPSKEPGLGIEIDEKVVNKYPYDGKGLHLQVSNKIIDF